MGLASKRSVLSWDWAASLHSIQRPHTCCSFGCRAITLWLEKRTRQSTLQ